MQGNRTSAAATLFRRPAILYPLVAAMVILVGFGAYAFYNNRPVAVEVVAEEHDVPVRVFGLGTVEARIRSDIGFEVGATLVELKADEGDRVKQGDLLGSLTLGEQQAKLEKAKAALLVADATVEKANANLGKTRAILAQKKDANARRQALAGQSVVSRQSAEEALRDDRRTVFSLIPVYHSAAVVSLDKKAGRPFATRSAAAL